MPLTVGILGVPFSAGWKPGKFEEAPDAIRRGRLLALLEQRGIDVRDLGNVPAPSSRRDMTSNPKFRNAKQVAEVAGNIAGRLQPALRDQIFPVILGGDCTLMIGSLRALSSVLKGAVGVLYLDAHGDFNTEATTESGLLGGMDLALVSEIGFGDLRTHFGSGAPLIQSANVVLFGARNLDQGEAKLIEESSLEFWDAKRIKKVGARKAAAQALQALAKKVSHLLVHVDLDVLEPRTISSLDMTVPDGLSLLELREVLAESARYPETVALEVTAFDSDKDADGSDAKTVANLIAGFVGALAGKRSQIMTG